MSLFETGPVVMTPGIRDIVNMGDHESSVIRECLERHCRGDWGDLCDDDKQLNQDSLDEEKRTGRSYDSLFSSYETDVGKIYIITECDRSVTTILTPEEY